MEKCFIGHLYHSLWHLILKISSEIYLVKFHFKRLKCRALMFFPLHPRRNGFRHVLSQQEIHFLNHPVRWQLSQKCWFSLIWPLCSEKARFAICGVLEEGDSPKQREICQITYRVSNILLMSLSSHSLPTPVSCVCCLGKTLFWFFNFLFTSLSTVNE